MTRQNRQHPTIARVTSTDHKTTEIKTRGILINPFDKTISDIEIGEGLRSIYDALSTGGVKVDIFEIINLDVVGRVRNTLYIDERARVRRAPVEAFFEIPGYHTTLLGCGLILGTKADGDSTSTTYVLDTVRKFIRFPA